MRIYGDLAPWFHSSPRRRTTRSRRAVSHADPRGGARSAHAARARFGRRQQRVAPQASTSPARSGRRLAADADTSRELNPDCEHVLGDMRTLRLGRTFDAVFVHDAVDVPDDRGRPARLHGDGVRPHEARRRGAVRPRLHARDVRAGHRSRRARRRRRARAALPRVDAPARAGRNDRSRRLRRPALGARGRRPRRPRSPCQRPLPGAHLALPARGSRVHAAARAWRPRDEDAAQPVFVCRRGVKR